MRALKHWPLCVRVPAIVNTRPNTCDSDPEFSHFLGNLQNHPQSDSGGSYISVYSVHTSDLSNWDEESSGGFHRFVPCLHRRRLQNGGGDRCGCLATIKPISDPVLQPFSQHVGPTTPLDLDATPLGYFYQYFPIEMLKSFAMQTNLYAQQKSRDHFVDAIYKC